MTVSLNTLAGGLPAAGTLAPPQIRSLGSVSGTVTIDASISEFYQLTVGGVTTLVLTGGSANQAKPLTLEITNGGAYTFNWPAEVEFAGGSAPSLTAAGMDVIQLYARGASAWVAARAGAAVS